VAVRKLYFDDVRGAHATRTEKATYAMKKTLVLLVFLLAHTCLIVWALQNWLLFAGMILLFLVWEEHTWI
jgi:hypothetical protein